MNKPTPSPATLAAEILKAEALKALRQRERDRALARKRRDLLAEMLDEGDPRATLEIVGRAALAAIRAEKSVSVAREKFLSFISA